MSFENTRGEIIYMKCLRREMTKTLDELFSTF